ncbi:penicillin-binding protein [Actinocatenispora rupis]|uniref:Penicillin-binding protein n=1 Tax=Actinocatenispora rupis TaxID=519421 RepID=A0A8J3J2B5_9ACTN|nr:penicillin-binding protein [Actinocatenispora rupis]
MLAAGVALVAVAGLAACGDSKEDAATKALTGFLANWRAGTLQKSAYSGASGATVAAAYKRVAGDLAGVHPTLKPGKVTVKGSKASAPVTVSWPLGGNTWSYPTTVRMVASGDAWKVAWSGSTVNPKLSGDAAITVSRDAAPRGSIVDGDGKPLVSEQPVVYVGVEPDKVKDPAGLTRTLSTALKTDLSDLPGRIRSAPPSSFVDVITLRRNDYEAVRDRIHDLPGVLFREGTLPLAPTRTFGRALLGTVGAVTKEQMEKHPGRYEIGDQAGQSGLQAAYDTRLGGKAGVTVKVGGSDPRVLWQQRPQAGQPLATTLDPTVQKAADAALATEKKHRTALVAIRISTGKVLAVANGPDGGSDDLALTASVPPGSTFKVVSSLAYLRAGVTPQTTVNCPKTVTVGGRKFHNENSFVLGQVPFHTDFAQSCNTAFAGLSSKLGNDTLTKQAAALGVGADWKLGVDVNTGSVPAANSAVDRAAAAFGQGRTTVSPIVMAGISAAVARGHWTQPVLITDPKVTPAADGPALPAADVKDLKGMMREVVTSGTATVLANVPGGPVYGKTGTAEYGSGSEPPSHSWFTGWQGDIAFAAFVEDGGTHENAVAAPLAAKFLKNLNG